MRANDGLNTEVIYDYIFASLQVREILHIYLTSILPSFAGRKMPTLANKAILIIELGIILDIPANDGLNTEFFLVSMIRIYLTYLNQLHLRFLFLTKKNLKYSSRNLFQ